MNYGGPYPFGPHPFQGPYPIHGPHGPVYAPPPFPPAPFPGPPPGVSFSPQIPQHPQWPAPGGPPISFQQGRDGWYYPVNYPQASPNHHLATQSLPPPIPNVPPQPTPPETPPKAVTPPEIQADLPEIDNYWKGRIVAGFLGSSTPKRFVTLSTHRPITIIKPSDDQKDSRPKLQLLPPRSYPPPPDPNSDHVSRYRPTYQYHLFISLSVRIFRLLEQIQNHLTNYLRLPKALMPHRHSTLTDMYVYGGLIMMILLAIKRVSLGRCIYTSVVEGYTKPAPDPSVSPTIATIPSHKLCSKLPSSEFG